MSCCCVIPGFRPLPCTLTGCAYVDSLVATDKYTGCTYVDNCLINNSNVSPCIGTPSQVIGSNPSTTTAPSSGMSSPPFLSALSGIALKAFSGIAAQSTLSAQQVIAKKTGTTSVSGAATSGLFLIVAVVIGLFVFIRLTK